MMNAYRFCIAPMMDYSDRHGRFFLRQFSTHIRLYTEMITAPAIIHGNRDELLGFHQQEHPVAVQLGGSDPAMLAEVAKICEDYGYDEINLNCGCPSDRVQSGQFGACLMLEPALVAECVSAMKSATDLPVTVKHRLGVDDQNDYDLFASFVEQQLAVGADAMIAHARNAWLQGLSPKQNREIPPLHYDWVYRLKTDFPQTTIVLNGGIKTIEDSVLHLQQVDGVMLGREPFHNPMLLAEVDRSIFADTSSPAVTREQVVEKMLPYIERNLSQGVALHHMLKPMMGLFNGVSNARRWRRYLSEHMFKKAAGIEVLEAALLQLDAVTQQDQFETA